MKARECARLLAVALVFALASLVLIILLGELPERMEVPLISREEYPFARIEKYPLLLLAVVNLFPIFEEWIFRSILLEEIMLRSNSKLVGVLFSSLIFAVFHLSNPGTYPALILPLTGAGFLLGACYLLSGLAGSIISHNAFNSIMVILTI